MAVGMAVATMGRDDPAAGEECAGSDELPDEAWREITVAEGSQGPRSYMFSAQRVRVTRKGKPGEGAWAVYRRNLDGSEPRYYLSNAPEDTMLETLAYVGGSRWRIESEFETEKGDVGLDEYETRSWAGWHHHIAMFLLGLQQDWGKKMPRERFGPDELLLSIGARKTENVFAIRPPVAVAIGVRKGPPQPDVPAQVWKTRLTGSAQKKSTYAW